MFEEHRRAGPRSGHISRSPEAAHPNGPRTQQPHTGTAGGGIITPALAPAAQRRERAAADLQRAWRASHRPVQAAAHQPAAVGTVRAQFVIASELVDTLTHLQRRNRAPPSHRQRLEQAASETWVEA